MGFFKWLGIFIFGIIAIVIANLLYDYIKLCWFESALENMYQSQVVEMQSNVIEVE